MCTVTIEKRDKINRLTDGPNQAARLFWSPDSQWIVHEEVESFGTGAGWNVKAVWAAAPDDSSTRKLYDTEWSGDEVFVEWIAPDQFLVYSWTPVGWRDVRVVDLNTGEAQLIGPKFEVQTLAYDPKTQTQLYFVDDFTAQQNGLSGGLYFATANQAKLIAAGDWYETRWLPHAQLFFAKGPDGVISVTPAGTVKEYADEEALPIDSPDGAWLLAWGDGNYTSPIGLRLYTPDGELKRTITSDSVDIRHVVARCHRRVLSIRRPAVFCGNPQRRTAVDRGKHRAGVEQYRVGKAVARSKRQVAGCKRLPSSEGLGP